MEMIQVMILAFSFLCLPNGLVDGGNGEYHRICVMDDQSQYRPGEGQLTPSDLKDVTMCTHLVYNYALVDANGTGLEVSGEYEEGNYQTIVALKADSPQIKILLGIGGPRGSSGFYDVVNGTESVNLFLEAVIQFVRDREFDGVVIDWIYDGLGDVGGTLNGFDLLLYEMANAFQNEATQANRAQLLIGIAIPGVRDSIDTIYPLESMAVYADMVMMKGYDFYNSEIPIIGHHSALFSRQDEDGYLSLLNVDFAVRYLLYSGIPPSKLILGIPSHGISQRFLNESQQYFGADSAGPGISGSFSQSSGRLAFFEICQLVDNGWTESFHEGHQVPFVFSNEDIVTFDNLESIRLKINYAKDSQLGGVSISSLGDDDFRGSFCNQGTFPLTKSFHEYIQRSRDNCYPGEFGAIDAPGCTSCPLGTYQPARHQTECVSCPEKQTTLSRGATKHLKCVADCPSGAEYHFFEKACTDCPLGFHRKADVHAYCIQCPEGETTVSSASSHCVQEPETFEATPAKRLDVEVTLLFHVTSCENKPVIIGIISQLVKEFVVDISSLWQGLCTSECPNVYFSHIKECHVRRKRSSDHTSSAAASTRDDSIEITVAMGNVTQNVENDQFVRRVVPVLAEAFDETTVFSSLDVYGVRYLGVTDLSTIVVCENGSAAINEMNCDMCPEGSFHNMTSSACESCPVGTYQGNEGMTFCEECETGKTTMMSEATSSKQCVSPCQAKPKYCYNSGVCHWDEGNPTSIYCQCADGYVGDRCENRKAYYMDRGAIIGTSVGAVSAFLLLLLIIFTVIFCTRRDRANRRSVDIIRRETSSTPSCHRVTSMSGTVHAQSSPNEIKYIDYFDFYPWLYASQQPVFQQHLYSYPQQQRRVQQAPRRIARHRSMPSSPTGQTFNVYEMPMTSSGTRENYSTLPRTSSKGGAFRSVVGKY